MPVITLNEQNINNSNFKFIQDKLFECNFIFKYLSKTQFDYNLNLNVPESKYTLKLEYNNITVTTFLYIYIYI